MPTESRELHTDVHPRHVDARHFIDTLELEHGVDLVLEIVQVPRVVLELVPFAILVQMMVPSSKSTTILASIEVGCVLDFYVVASLIVDNLPVLALDPIVHLLIVVPVDVFVLALTLLRNSLEIAERVAYAILVERLPLRQFLQLLVSGGQAPITSDVKAEFWPEAGRWNDLDAAVLVHPFLVVKIFDVVDGIFEFFFSGPVNWHFINFFKLIVDIF